MITHYDMQTGQPIVPETDDPTFAPLSETRPLTARLMTVEEARQVEMEHEIPTGILATPVATILRDQH